MKIKLPYLATVIAAVLLLFIGHKFATDCLHVFQNVSQEVVRAKVQRIVERVQPNFDFLDDEDDFFDVLPPISAVHYRLSLF